MILKLRADVSHVVASVLVSLAVALALTNNNVVEGRKLRLATGSQAPLSRPTFANSRIGDGNTGGTGSLLSLNRIQDPLHAIDSAIGHVSGKSFVLDENAAASPPVMMSGLSGDQDAGKDAEGQSAGVGAIPDRPPLVNFENNVPPRRTPSSPALELTSLKLIEHSFANSYGKPARASYRVAALPESFQDPSKWTSIALEQVGTARGRQFDRLGSIFFNRVEVVRTDNAEPVNTTGGIVWRTTKDVSKYYDLFRNDADVLFDYPNIVDETYTSPLNLTLSVVIQQLVSAAPANASNSSDGNCLNNPSPLYTRTPTRIFPISKDGPELFNVPNDTATATFITPRNTLKAILEVYASGTAADEFWYTGVNDDLFNRAINGTNALTPHGPYREIQVTIDGKIAGIAAPYPVVFTGGLNPLLWRPQASYGAYDQPTYLFDVTPFLGLISDGKPHTYGIKVRSAEKDGSIPSGWFVTGNLQLILSEGATDAVTTGGPPTIQGPTGTFTLSGRVSEPDFNGTKGALTSDASTNDPRALTVVSKITPAGSNAPMDVRVTHSIDYTSHQDVKMSGGQATQSSTTKGNQQSFHGPLPFLSIDYSFPLSTYIASDNSSLNATLQSTYQQRVAFGGAATGAEGTCETSDIPSFGLPTSSTYDVSQDAKAETVIVDGKLRGGVGGNNVTFSYADSQGFTFDRTIKTYNYTVTQDDISGTLKDLAPPSR